MNKSTRGSLNLEPEIHHARELLGRCGKPSPQIAPPALDAMMQHDSFPRIRPEAFRDQCEEGPAVIGGLGDDWPARQWSKASLISKYGPYRFRTCPARLALSLGVGAVGVGNADSGEVVAVSMEQFIDYCDQGAADDPNPLYLYVVHDSIKALIAHNTLQVSPYRPVFREGVQRKRAST